MPTGYRKEERRARERERLAQAEGWTGEQELAAAIGSNRYRLASMGPANGAAIVTAFATATRSEGMLRGR